MSELDVDAIEARANAARSGPWKWHWDVFGDGSSSLDYLDGGGGFVLSAHGMHTEGWIDADDSDAEFIAHARTDIPALVSRVRELEAREKRVREVVDRVDGVADEVAAVAAQDPVGTAIVEAYRTITTQIRAELEDPS